MSVCRDYTNHSDIEIPPGKKSSIPPLLRILSAHRFRRKPATSEYFPRTGDECKCPNGSGKIFSLDRAFPCRVDHSRVLPTTTLQPPRCSGKFTFHPGTESRRKRISPRRGVKSVVGAGLSTRYFRKKRSGGRPDGAGGSSVEGNYRGSLPPFRETISIVACSRGSCKRGILSPRALFRICGTRCNPHFRKSL